MTLFDAFPEEGALASRTIQPLCMTDSSYGSSVVIDHVRSLAGIVPAPDNGSSPSTLNGVQTTREWSRNSDLMIALDPGCRTL